MTRSDHTAEAVLVEWVCPVCGRSEQFLAERPDARRRGCAALKSHFRAIDAEESPDHPETPTTPDLGECVEISHVDIGRGQL